MIGRITIRVAEFIAQKLTIRAYCSVHLCPVNSRLLTLRASVHSPVVGCTRSLTNFVDHGSALPSGDKEVEESLDYSLFCELGQDSYTERQIKLIIMEYEISKQSEGRVPSTITVDQMKELLSFPSELRRAKHFNYLFKKEKAKLRDERRKERKRAEYEKRKQEREAIGPKNSFFLHIRDQSMLKFYNSRQAHSMIFGSNLVFDMGYDEYMTKKEKINCAYQIAMAYGANKVHREPFNLYLCNAKSNYEVMENVRKAIPHLYAANCLINVTELSYLDIFPKDRIVYLTPNANEMLNNFDYDTVYIVGAFVDKSHPKPISLAKAKRENLRVAKLPLDYYLHWGLGSKTLTLNQLTDIMLEVKSSNNWNEAFKFVPTRKLQGIDLSAIKTTKSNKKTSNLIKRWSLLEKD